MKLAELCPNSITIKLTDKQYKRLQKIGNTYQKEPSKSRNIIIELINRRYKYTYGSYRV